MAEYQQMKPAGHSAAGHVSGLNLKSATEDPLTKAEMEAIKAIDKNCRLVKGQVFTWKGATWEDLWND